MTFERESADKRRIEARMNYERALILKDEQISAKI